MLGMFVELSGGPDEPGRTPLEVSERCVPQNRPAGAAKQRLRRMEWPGRRPPRSVVTMAQEHTALRQSRGQSLESASPLFGSEYLERAQLDDELEGTRAKGRVQHAADDEFHTAAGATQGRLDDELGLSRPETPCRREAQRGGRDVEGGNRESRLREDPGLLGYSAACAEYPRQAVPRHEADELRIVAKHVVQRRGQAVGHLVVPVAVPGLRVARAGRR